jgi:hypothetical protein
MTTCLVIANQTLGGPHLREAIEQRIHREPCHFHVVVPVTPVGDLFQHALDAYRGDLPDEARARAEARDRLDRLVESLRASGIDATGALGDPDPLRAVHDAIAQQDVDDIIVSTLPPLISQWLKHDLIHRIEATVSVPVTHIYEARETFRADPAS